MIYLKTTILVLLYCLLGCSESKFKGNTSKDGPVQNQLPGQFQPGCDFNRDFVQLEDLPAPIQECENNGGFYFYLDGKCFNYSVPKSNCSLESIKSTLISYSIPTQSIDSAIANNAKILDCRQFPEVRTVAVNWWFPNSNQTDCRYSESLNLATACYRVLPPGQTSSADPVEKARSCLNSL